MQSDINRFFAVNLQKEMRTTYVFLITITLHVQELMFFLMAGKLLCCHLNEKEIIQVDVPPSFWWEYVWCCSVVLQAIFKDRNVAVTMFTALCSILPMAYGFSRHLSDWMIQTKSEAGAVGHLMWKGVPLVIVMGPIIIFIITVRMFYIYLWWNMKR